MGLKTECEQTRSRSEYYLSKSELDTVVGNDVKKEPNISEGITNLDLNV